MLIVLFATVFTLCAWFTTFTNKSERHGDIEAPNEIEVIRSVQRQTGLGVHSNSWGKHALHTDVSGLHRPTSLS